MSSPIPGRRSVLTWLVPLVVLALVVGLWWAATRDDASGEDRGARPGPGGTAYPSVTAYPRGTPSSQAESPSGTVRPSGSRATPDSGLARVRESELPREARATLELIRAGGPYPYDQDDETFGNRERLLPPKPRGYYREYTVRTPGEGDRGPRRIVGGRDGDRYWTSDHYESFRQIEEGQ